MLDKERSKLIQTVTEIQESDVAAVVIVMDRFGNVHMTPSGPLHGIGYCATNLNWFINRMIDDSSKKPAPPTIAPKEN